MPTQTLVDFLLARIAEDEAIAQAALRPRYSESDEPQWSYDGNPSGAVTAGRYVIAQASTWEQHDPDGGRLARHIARWDPARVLAECAAKRAIIERLTPDPTGTRDSAPAFQEQLNGEPTLKLLAAVYSNHPDYQQTWRP
jgi:hypothetical protein